MRHFPAAFLGRWKQWWWMDRVLQQTVERIIYLKNNNDADVLPEAFGQKLSTKPRPIRTVAGSVACISPPGGVCTTTIFFERSIPPAHVYFLCFVWVYAFISASFQLINIQIFYDFGLPASIRFVIIASSPSRSWNCCLLAGKRIPSQGTIAFMGLCISALATIGIRGFRW